MSDTDAHMVDANHSDAEEAVQHGFKLKSLLMDQVEPASPTSAPHLSSAAFFPWHKASIRTLWGGGRSRPWNTAEEDWTKIVRRWMGCMAVCAREELRFVQTRGDKLTKFAALRTRDDEKLHSATWALDFKTLHPLVAFAGETGIIYIFDVEAWKMIGAITGHGGPITHLTTHPIRPDYILSTSHDFTARMWSLADPVDTPTMPLFWPGQKRLALDVEPEMAFSQMTLSSAPRVIPIDALVMRTGPPGGVPDVTQAGKGMGICVAVFKGTGEVLGGHDSWVMCADFHPTRPFVVTCGADRAVKIWRVPDFPTPETRPLRGVNYHTIERPLFSCTHLHETSVEYVAWLKDDILVSKSKYLSMENLDFHGTIMVWQWLDANRFAPEGMEVREHVVKPSHWDWKESRSYTTLARIVLPHETMSGWRISSTFNSPYFFLTSKTDAVHVVDIERHQGTPEDVLRRMRKIEQRLVRRGPNGRKRTIEYPEQAHLDDMPHPMVTARRGGGSLQILRAMANPLSPRVLVGLGKDGTMLLWRDESEVPAL